MLCYLQPSHLSLNVTWDIVWRGGAYSIFSTQYENTHYYMSDLICSRDDNVGGISDLHCWIVLSQGQIRCCYFAQLNTWIHEHWNNHNFLFTGTQLQASIPKSSVWSMRGYGSTAFYFHIFHKHAVVSHPATCHVKHDDSADDWNRLNIMLELPILPCRTNESTSKYFLDEWHNHSIIPSVFSMHGNINPAFIANTVVYTHAKHDSTW